MYNEVMATRGFKVPLTDDEIDDREVPGYLMSFTGKDLKRLEELKVELELKEEQDVVRLALRMLEKLLDPKPKPKVTLKKGYKSDDR